MNLNIFVSIDRKYKCMYKYMYNMNTNMDILVIENYLLIKNDQCEQLVDNNFKDYLKNG